jgi:AcrR family transcriptional regulator
VPSTPFPPAPIRTGGYGCSHPEERGYEGTTIRAVASLVGIDPSMVMRYYGSETGLFSAAVDLDLHLDKVPQPRMDRLREMIIRHFLSRWEGDLSDEAITLLLRSASTNPMAAEPCWSITPFMDVYSLP